MKKLCGKTIVTIFRPESNGFTQELGTHTIHEKNMVYLPDMKFSKKINYIHVYVNITMHTSYMVWYLLAQITKKSTT